MNFYDFHNRFREFGCFSWDQVRAWRPDFARGNIVRWVASGKLLRLKRGFYAFPDALNVPDMGLHVGTAIYSPSYASLEWVLSRHELIPESVVAYTCVTSRKTMSLRNAFGAFEYRSVREDLMFGYESEPIRGGKLHSFVATPEKALLDLLYLEPQYDSASAIAELRLDGDVVREGFDWPLFDDFLSRFRCIALERRAGIVRKEFRP